jgi:hypothetical protein
MIESDRLHSRELPKEGLPPRDRNAKVPEHANSSAVWMGGVIAVFAVLALVLFGNTRTNDIASSPNLNTEQGMTTGAAPASSSKVK